MDILVPQVCLEDYNWNPTQRVDCQNHMSQKNLTSYCWNHQTSYVLQLVLHKGLREWHCCQSDAHHSNLEDHWYGNHKAHLSVASPMVQIQHHDEQPQTIFFLIYITKRVCLLLLECAIYFQFCLYWGPAWSPQYQHHILQLLSWKAV